MYLFEHKWWTFPGPAFKQASVQLEKYKDYNIGQETPKVKGAYAAILIWDIANLRGELRLSKVWSKE